MKKILFFAGALAMGSSIFAQQKHDKTVFKSFKPGYYQNSILKDVRAVDEQLEKAEKEKKFFMDQSTYDLPNKMELYKDHRVWAQPTLSQGNAGTCWDFCTTSFYESEVYRLHNKKVKISEMFTAYWEYVEKARRFVQQRGNSLFAQGSEGNAVARVWEKYGVCPRSAYDGLLHGRKFYTHEKMYNEMLAYLNGLKESHAWNEAEVLSTIKDILNHYMGVPPTSFVVEGKEYTPKSYLKNYLKLNMKDYVEVLSYMQEPYWQKVEYKVPDNWWHSKEYYNMPLDDFMKVVKTAIRNGYSMSIGGDVSEAGFLRTTNCAIVPSFDIPSAYINEQARQFRFSNGSTTDDHGMHLIGYYVDKDGKDWYLIKDSSSGSRNIDEKSAEFGYYFFTEDYFKLKMMGFTVHKDAIKDYIKKFK